MKRQNRWFSHTLEPIGSSMDANYSIIMTANVLAAFMAPSESGLAGLEWKHVYLRRISAAYTKLKMSRNEGSAPENDSLLHRWSRLRNWYAHRVSVSCRGMRTPFFHDHGTWQGLAGPHSPGAKRHFRDLHLILIVRWCLEVADAQLKIYRVPTRTSTVNTINNIGNHHKEATCTVGRHYTGCMWRC